MKVSVVMATYNGERFIKEQIESIIAQTREPDEVLIFDDGSKDNTCRIIRDFIAQYKLETKWHLYINTENKGCVRNFVEGGVSATGDVVFYSDQDDIWDIHKIEKMISGFEEYPDMLSCYCLRTYIDSDNLPIKLRFERLSNVPIRKKGFQKISLDEVIKYNKSPGLCLAIRRELLAETKKMILDNRLTHDLPIGTVAAIKDGYYVLNERLVKYRQHETNISNPRYTVKSRISNIDLQIAGREQRLKQMIVIYKKYKSMLSETEKKDLRKAIICTKKSIEYLKNKDLIGLLTMLTVKSPMINIWISINNIAACAKSLVK